MGDLREEVVKDMMPKLIGETYLKKPTEASSKKARYGLYECPYCGKEWECQTYSIKSGNTKSCGCISLDIRTTHGLSNSIFYTRWRDMRGRCTNPKHKSYKDYGGRGITICEEWLDVTNFIEWCDLTYIEGMSLDRIDNDKGYSPENCRWTTRTIQSINQRTMKNNKSGYVGVSWRKDRNKWIVRIRTKVKYECLGHFEDLMEAVIFRDKYIIDNKLPHKLNLKHVGENK